MGIVTAEVEVTVGHVPSKSMFCPRYFVLVHTICLKNLFCNVVFTSLGCY